MRIGLDARFLSHPQQGGFKTYTENLVASLAALESPHSFVAYTDRPASLRPFEHGRFAVLPVDGAGNLKRIWREQVALPRQAARDGIDLLHSLAQTAPLRPGLPLVVTIHDTFSLVPMRFAPGPTSSSNRIRLLYERIVGRRAGRIAARVITVSEVSKRALMKELGLPEGRIVAIHEAPAPHFEAIDRDCAAAEVERHFGLRSPYALHLTSTDGRKNTPTVMQAMRRLGPEVKIDLVLAGAGAPPDATAGDPHVHALGVVSDAELILLYNAAAVFVAPSLGEGFGLPLLESMACGTPVIAADATSMPEIAGDAAVLVRATDAEALARAIASLVIDPQRRGDLVRRGRERVARFSWRRCAEATVAVYEEVLASAR